MSRKARILLACGMVCLFAGTELPMFVPVAKGAAHLWLEGARGLLLGLAVSLNLGAVVFDRLNCQPR